LATTAALAFGGIAAPVVAKGHQGHHKTWSAAKCNKKAAQWQKAHRHPSAKQTAKENRNLAKHGCANTV
jgi:hypothetical protein